MEKLKLEKYQRFGEIFVQCKEHNAMKYLQCEISFAPESWR